MGKFSRDTFDPLKRYVSVRLQQGVPLLDADWNEMEDIRRAELRTFLKWFIGDGIPANEDGTKSKAFQIVANDPPNDSFKILRGGTSDALGAGRCLVDGMEVFITQDLDFTEQPLYENYASPTPPTNLDVTPVEPNAPKIKGIPETAGSYRVYLDVWEWEVEASVDRPHLVNESLGVETCVRLKRSWAVRVFKAEEEERLPNHSYYLLANFSRPRVVTGGAAITITPQRITDRRQTRLTLAELAFRIQAMEQKLFSPVFARTPREFWPPLAQAGVEVTLFGENFNVTPPTVFFGEVEAEVVSATDTQIVAIVPDVTPSDINIQVGNEFGSATSSTTFRVPTPGPLPPSTIWDYFPRQGRPGEEVHYRTGRVPVDERVGLLFWFDRSSVSVTVREEHLGPGGSGGTRTETHFYFQVPSIQPGEVSVSVQNNHGISLDVATFTVLADSPYGYSSSSGIGGGIV